MMYLFVYSEMSCCLKHSQPFFPLQWLLYQSLKLNLIVLPPNRNNLKNVSFFHKPPWSSVPQQCRNSVPIHQLGTKFVDASGRVLNAKSIALLEACESGMDAWSVGRHNSAICADWEEIQVNVMLAPPGGQSRQVGVVGAASSGVADHR